MAGLLWLLAGLALAQTESRIADELVALTNVDRTSNGLAALSVDRRLTELAVERSADMIARDYFSHSIPPAGETVFDLMSGREITFRAAGENLAFNTAPRAQTAGHAEGDLMNSPGHRALILSPNFDHLGVGVAFGADERIMYTVLFAGLGESGPDTVTPPMLGGADAPPPPSTPPAPSPGVPPTPRPVLLEAEPLSGAGRLRTAATQPLGLIENLVNRTLRLYLGL